VYTSSGQFEKVGHVHIFSLFTPVHSVCFRRDTFNVQNLMCEKKKRPKLVSSKILRSTKPIPSQEKVDIILL